MREDKRRQDLENLKIFKRWYFSKTKRWKRYRSATKKLIKKEWG